MFLNILWNPNIVRTFVEQNRTKVQTLKNDTMTTETKQVVNVTFNEMLNKLMSIEKGTLCGCKMVTIPRMLTGGRRDKVTGQYPNQYVDRVKKVTTGTFTCGSSYLDRIKKECEKRKLDFTQWVVEDSKVGEHVSKCVTYNENTNNYCFQMEIHRNNPHNHVKSVYLVDGETVDQMIQRNFEQYLVKTKPSEKQLDFGIDETVDMFSPSVKNIKEFTVDGVMYVLQD